jgi:hypothetical protein
VAPTFAANVLVPDPPITPIPNPCTLTYAPGTSTTPVNNEFLDFEGDWFATTNEPFYGDGNGELTLSDTNPTFDTRFNPTPFTLLGGESITVVWRPTSGDANLVIWVAYKDGSSDIFPHTQSQSFVNVNTLAVLSGAGKQIDGWGLAFTSAVPGVDLDVYIDEIRIYYPECPNITPATPTPTATGPTPTPTPAGPTPTPGPTATPSCSVQTVYVSGYVSGGTDPPYPWTEATWPTSPEIYGAPDTVYGRVGVAADDHTYHSFTFPQIITGSVQIQMAYTQIGSVAQEVSCVSGLQNENVGSPGFTKCSTEATFTNWFTTGPVGSIFVRGKGAVFGASDMDFDWISVTGEVCTYPTPTPTSGAPTETPTATPTETSTPFGTPPTGVPPSTATPSPTPLPGQGQPTTTPVPSSTPFPTSVPQATDVPSGGGTPGTTPIIDGPGYPTQGTCEPTDPGCINDGVTTNQLVAILVPLPDYVTDPSHPLVEIPPPSSCGYIPFWSCSSRVFPSFPGLTLDIGLYFAFLSNVLYYATSTILCFLKTMLNMFIYFLNLWVISGCILQYLWELAGTIMGILKDWLTAFFDIIFGIVSSLTASLSLPGSPTLNGYDVGYVIFSMAVFFNTGLVGELMAFIYPLLALKLAVGIIRNVTNSKNNEPWSTVAETSASPGVERATSTASSKPTSSFRRSG